MPDIVYEAAIHPTEDAERIKAAILNIFPGTELAVEGGMISGTGKSLEYFATKLEEQRIRDTATSCWSGLRFFSRAKLHCSPEQSSDSRSET